MKFLRALLVVLTTGLFLGLPVTSAEAAVPRPSATGECPPPGGPLARAMTELPCEPQPPDVERREPRSVSGCDVVLGGTRYGAGVLRYDELYTDTYEFNPDTEEWELVRDTTPTIANLTFTPWTTAQQVQAGCVTVPPEPAPTTSVVKNEQCVGNTMVTTTTTTTTSYVHDAATNTWVPGQPVTTTQVAEQPLAAGCDDDGPSNPPGNDNDNDNDNEPEVGGVSASSNPTPVTAPVTAAAPVRSAPARPAPVPTAVDAGLAGSDGEGPAGSPWAVLAVALGLLLAAGSTVARRRG